MMIRCFFLLYLGFITSDYAQNNTDVRTIHVFVALCDNVNQGIVPVPKTLGDGQNPRTNLYWGALYGVKTHFKKSTDWKIVKTIENKRDDILESVLFKHLATNTYLLAEAYDGKYIKQTTKDFLAASGGDQIKTLQHNEITLAFGGGADLVAYVGHDGLMEFKLDDNFATCVNGKDAIVLACVSKSYFKPYFTKTGANPLVWSTGLMSPEAYTLEASIKGWVKNETDAQIRERAAQAYHKYQKCGIRGARNLLVTGY